MFAILAFIAFIIAGLLEFLGGHAKDVLWLIIIGGFLLSATVAWGWAGPRFRGD